MKRDPGIGVPGEACDAPLTLSCAGHAQKVQLICDSAARKWTLLGACTGNQLCDTQSGPNQGSCQDPIPGCIGRRPGDTLCEGNSAVECGPDLVTRSVMSCPNACVDGKCAGACAAGQTRCTDGTPESCNADGQWLAGAPCPFACAGGQCTGECTPSEKRCNGPVPQECDGDGRWQSASQCAKVCVAGECADSCVDGTKQCSGGLVPQTCSGGTWQDAEPCPFLCRGDACSGECSPGSTRCTGLTPEACGVDGTWKSGASCSYVCASATNTCVGVCAPGSKRCSGLVAESCDGNGDWQSSGSCTYACASGDCTGVCSPGSKRCDGKVPQSCDATGQWQSEPICDVLCTAGMCASSCSAGTKQCNGLVPQSCGTDGQWIDGAACPFVCASGACTGVCSPGAKTCNGLQPQTCDASGQWQNTGSPCSYVCVSASATCTGVCAPGSRRCSSSVPQMCDANGQWQSEAPCAAFCIDGMCSSAPPSCQGASGGCGATGNVDCCASLLVPSGTFNRSNNASYPATVSDFRLDKYEITVGRFRKFVQAYPGSKPVAGAGTHPKIGGSGWSSTWDGDLPSDQAALVSALKCSPSAQTWTDMPGANENKPINCISWYVAFAFCAWDGGRLPTEAEWNYAAAGGSEQREYPWGMGLDCTRANYQACGGQPNVAGGAASGLAKWSQADLSGNVSEWNLDAYVNPYSSSSCGDCATLSGSSERVRRGGYFNSSTSGSLLTSDRQHSGASTRSNSGGARCARQ